MKRRKITGVPGVLMQNIRVFVSCAAQSDRVRHPNIGRNSSMARFCLALWAVLSAGTGFLGATPATPIIDGVNPNSGAAATTIGITLDQNASISAVYFGTTSASFSQQNPTQLNVTVPAGAGSVDITVVSSTNATSALTPND